MAGFNLAWKKGIHRAEKTGAYKTPWGWFSVFALAAALVVTGCASGGGSGEENGGGGGLQCPTGTTLFVHAANGLDTNTGDQTTPLASVTAAFDAAETCTGVTEIHVAEGTYSTTSTTLVLLEGVSLLGGYAASDWELRDAAVYVTTLEKNSTSGGTFDGPTAVIRANAAITPATLVEGFSILPGDGSYTAGVFLNAGSPTIFGNTIFGGSGATFETYGILVTDSDAVISGNKIYAQGGFRDSMGMVLTGASAPEITGNLIDGGFGDRDSYAILALVGTAPVISANIIDGGSGDGDSRGIVSSQAEPVIFNNVIFGGTSSFGETHGVSFTGFSDPVLLENNTIHGGTGPVASVGISMFSSSVPRISNNIVFTGGSGDRVCVYEGNTSADPFIFVTNDLFDCPTGLYGDADTATFLTDIADVNALGTAFDNISEDPQLADLTGDDNQLSTTGDNDWRLTASSPTTVTDGGSDISAVFTVDADGVTRTVPWSMGAFEYDAP